jgi:hypothetical protein
MAETTNLISMPIQTQAKRPHTDPLKATRATLKIDENATPKSICIAYRREPGVPTGVPRFIIGGLTTADLGADLGATLLLAKNLCTRASFGEMRFSTFMCRLALSKSARSFNSLTVGPPVVMFRAAS